jgi:hypothetical protein
MVTTVSHKTLVPSYWSTWYHFPECHNVHTHSSSKTDSKDHYLSHSSTLLNAPTKMFWRHLTFCVLTTNNTARHNKKPENCITTLYFWNVYTISLQRQSASYRCPLCWWFQFVSFSFQLFHTIISLLFIFRLCNLLCEILLILRQSNKPNKRETVSLPHKNR